jgi:hypothetical protein
VNGVLASSTNSFSTWGADIPVGAGSNTITVTGRDAAGNVATASVTVVNETPVITFPPADALSSGAALNVTGTAGGTLPVANLAVGYRADDGFAHWRATVPLVDGENELVVTMTHPQTPAVATMATRTVINQPLPPLTRPTDLALDAVNERLLLIDESTKALYAVALDTGERTVLSGLSVGSGARLEPRSTPRTASILCGTFFGLYGIRLGDGARTFISGDTRGAGSRLLWPFAILTGPALGWSGCCDWTGVLPPDFVYATGSNRVVVDVATGDRTTGWGYTGPTNNCGGGPQGTDIVHMYRNPNGEGYFYITSTHGVFEETPCRTRWEPRPPLV